MSNQLYDVIIIGSGPAGLSAGLYCARDKLKTLVISKDVGGQIATSSEIENYLGFSLMPGPELIKKFEEHLKEYEIERKIGVAVEKISGQAGEFTAQTNMGDFKAKAIILATGGQHKKLNIRGEEKLKGQGVSYCAICDAPFYKDRAVVVIGGGNSAMEVVHHLDKIAKKIYLLNINEKFGSEADPLLIERVYQCKKADIISNAEVKEILGEKKVEGVKYLDKNSNQEKTIAVEGVFVEVGSEPTTGFVQNLIELNDKKEIKIDDHNMTSVKGIFAAGDSTEVPFKQVIVAAGEGAKAAIGVSEFLAT